MPFYKEVYDGQMEIKGANNDYNPKEEMVQNLVNDIEKQYVQILKCGL